jgi:DNA-directed RNA polymerase subunit RPC12/RpoP
MNTNLPADYAKGEYTRERRLFIQELKTKSFDEVMKKYQPEPLKPKPVVKPPVKPAPPKKKPASVPSNYDIEDDDYAEPPDQLGKRNKGRKAYLIECPKCRAAVKFPHNKRMDKDAVRCPDCSQWMRHP